MKSVTLTHELQGYIRPFTGKTLEAAIEAAQTWAKDNKLTLNNYYAQASGRAILVGYSMTRTEEEIIDDLIASTKNLISLLKAEQP